MIFIVLCVLIIMFLILYDLYVLKNVKDFNVPGPKLVPFIGNGHFFLGDSAAFLKTIGELIEKYGSLVRVYIMSVRFVFIVEPNHIEAILSSMEHVTKGESYNFLHPWLGQGLLTATGNRWKKHRKFLTPAFHFNILKTFLPTFYKNDEVFVKKLEAVADGACVDVFPLVAMLALDNITESAMCVSVNAQKDSESEYVKAVTDISEVISKRIRHPLLRTDAFFKLSSAKMRHDQALSVLHRFTEQVVKDRRDALDAAETTLSNYDSEIGIKKKSAFLDLLLLSEIDGQKLDNKSVREEVDTFMFEGHDTTTSGICFTLYCLSKHSDVQEKVLQEQYELFGDDRHRHPTYNELGSMRYLEMVIRESLRLYPSVPLITRILTEDTKIAGTYVPKDTNLLISIFHMQRHPSIYEDPLVFKPERFDPAQRNHQNAYNWVAFSAGPRNCIGQKFAMMEMKLCVSSIIRKFKIFPSSNEDPVLCGDLILRSKNGIQLKILPRK